MEWISITYRQMSAKSAVYVYVYINIYYFYYKKKTNKKRDFRF